jgi:hypothetical protein
VGATGQQGGTTSNVAATTLPAPVRAVLAGAIDYAGLFPPAALGMHEAVTNYATYRRGGDVWALGRFVVPVARLEEFSGAMRHVGSDEGPRGWSVSVLSGADPGADLRAIRSFNGREQARALIETVEARAASAADVEHLASLVAAGFEVFVEIPVDADVESIAQAVARVGARAKIRTGGVTPDAIPATRQVVHFLRACRELGLAFKATAGLHHALRGVYRLTDSPGGPRAEMFGYLNVMLAAVLSWQGEDGATVAAMLEERRADVLHLADEGNALVWQGHRLDAGQILQARTTFARGFGSCSFREPLDEASTLSAVLRP